MPTRLTTWTNSFQTFEEAQTAALDRVDLGGFNAASTQDLAETALIQAYHAIKKFAFYDPEFSETKPEPFTIPGLTVEERALLSDNFLYALRLSQVCEADSLLGGEPGSIEAMVEKKRRAGIREEVVGESQVKFNLTADTRSTIHKRTLEVLSQYIYRGITIGRA